MFSEKGKKGKKVIIIEFQVGLTVNMERTRLTYKTFPDNQSRSLLGTKL